MSKRISKLLSMLLAAVMILSMAMTGLAATSSDEDAFSITVKQAADGETYSAYKIFDVTYSDNNYAYTIDSSSAWLVVENGSAYVYGDPNSAVFTLTETSVSGVYNVSFSSNVSEADILAVFTSLPEDAVAVDEKLASNGTVTLEVEDAGYYYVTTTLGSLVIIDTTNPNPEIDEKNGIPYTEKLVDNEVVENETKANYVINVPNVRGVLNLVIEDAMNYAIDDNGNLTQGDVNVTYEFDWESLEVTLIDGTNETLLEEDADYTLNKEPNDDCDFHIEFTYDFSSCSSDASIQVKISCTIIAEGAEFANDEEEVPNSAKVTFGNESESKWDEADIYEYGFEIFKYTGEEESQKALADAEFQLSRTVTNEETGEDSIEYATFKKNDNGEYVLTSWTEDADDTTTKISSNSDGYIYVEGLGEGDYTLTETVAPDGYNILGSSITVTITADNNDKSQFTVTYTGAERNEDHIVRVENNSGSILPGTGGIGTTIFYVVGTLLVLAAAALVVAKMRLGKTE